MIALNGIPERKRRRPGRPKIRWQDVVNYIYSGLEEVADTVMIREAFWSRLKIHL